LQSVYVKHLCALDFKLKKARLWHGVAVLQESATIQNIKSGFKRMGILPLNRNTILDDAPSQVHSVTNSPQKHKRCSEKSQKNFVCPQFKGSRKGRVLLSRH
jgi:hypothetical protein